MLFVHIVHHYLGWHYLKALSELLHLWKNFAWFTIHFFSIPQLMRSWFSPWKRVEEQRINKWSFEDLVGYIFIGLLSRLIGFIVRSAIIAIGLVSLLLVSVAGVIMFVTWYLLPAIVLGMLLIGIVIILHNTIL